MEFADGAEGENIWIASSDGDVKRVMELLESGVSVNAQDEQGYSPLHAAVSYGHIELITLLLDRGAAIDLKDAEGDVPLLVCEEVEALELLLSRGASLEVSNMLNQDIGFKAVEDENEELVEWLVDKKVLTEERVKELKNELFPASSFEANEEGVVTMDILQQMQGLQKQMEEGYEEDEGDGQ